MTQPDDDRTFQQRTARWLRNTFGAESPALEIKERRDRFFEEAIELFQATEGSAAEAHILVDYVFNRPRGDARQEVGGVMITLAGLCSTLDLSMYVAGDAGLAEAVKKSDKIKAKFESKPKDSPLPGAGEE